MHRIFPTVTWLGLVLFAMFGPPMRADWWPWVVDLMMGRFQGTNPIIVGHFYSMGVWPILLLFQLRPYWFSKPVPALPFALGAFGLGAFAVLPWMALRADPRTTPNTARFNRIEFICAPIMGLLGAAFIAIGFAFGDVSDWLNTLNADNFVWTMSADFLVLWGISIAIAREQGSHDDQNRWVRTIIPFIGTAWW